MKHYVQYHNTLMRGRLVPRTDGFQIIAKKSIRHLLGNRVWLISGEGVRSPKAYYLRYVFTVDEVIAGSPNVALGHIGRSFDFSLPLNQEPWFNDFIEDQQRFSLGVREIQDEFMAYLDEFSSRC
jgi:hypothetical protein